MNISDIQIKPITNPAEFEEASRLIDELVDVDLIADPVGRHTSVNVNKARELLALLNDEYERQYYSGIICERQGSAILHYRTSSDHFAAYEWLVNAMEHFEKAEAIRPPGMTTLSSDGIPVRVSS